METNDLIMRELEDLPDALAVNVLNYIKILKKNQYEFLEEISFSNSYVSEKSFAKVWLNEVDSEYDKL